ncbi:MAG: hypothetical protein ABSB15_26435 [Bryobacteraceae bacterium]|jgi:hypothetical protein
MWLLDANLDIHLAELLSGFHIAGARAESRGWKALRNGALVAAAAQAARTWRAFPNFAVVVIMLPQLPTKRYLEVFREVWAASPIQPVPGKIVTWP